MPATNIASNAPTNGTSEWKPYYYQSLFMGAQDSGYLNDDGEKYIEQTSGSTASRVRIKCTDARNCNYAYKITINKPLADESYTVNKYKKNKDGSVGAIVETLLCVSASTGWNRFEYIADRWYTFDVGVYINFASMIGQTHNDEYTIIMPTLAQMERRRIYFGGLANHIRLVSQEGKSSHSGPIPANLKDKSLTVMVGGNHVDPYDSSDGANDGLINNLYPADPDVSQGMVVPGVNIGLMWNVNPQGEHNISSSTNTSNEWPHDDEEWQRGTDIFNDAENFYIGNHSAYTPVHLPYSDRAAGTYETGFTQTINVQSAGRAGHACIVVDVDSDATGDTQRIADNTWWPIILIIS